MDDSRSRIEVSPVGEYQLERITRNGFILMILFIAGALIFRSWGAAVSVALGGFLAWLNFRWLKIGVDAILTRQKAPPISSIMTRFLGRLILISVGLFAIIQLSFLSLIGAVLGLSIFVLTGIFEAIYQLIHRTS